MAIRILGAHRTGTNYIEQLVHTNIMPPNSTAVLAMGEWKHDFVPRYDDIDANLRAEANNKLIIIIKNPYTWYTSALWWVNAYHKSPLEFVWGDCSAAAIFDRYNLLYKSHKAVLDGDNKDTVYTDSILIRYEDLLIDPEHELQRIIDRFDTTWKKKFENVTNIPQAAKWTEEKREYYIKQQPSYDQHTIEMVTEVVDWELMDFYSYYKIKGDGE